MPAILPYGTFVAVRPLFQCWPWIPARIIGLDVDAAGKPWYRVECAAHVGGCQYTFNEHYIVRAEFEPRE